jgi:hypothetical protein
MARNTWQNLLNEDSRGLSADGLTLASFTTSAPVFPTLVLPANYLKTGRLISVKAKGIWAATATATVDTTIAQTWGVEIACSASSASNTVKGIILEVTAKN